MPFKSEQQRKFLWAKYPDLARLWTKKYGPKPKPRKLKTFKKKDK